MAVYDPDLWPANWILSLIARGEIKRFYKSREWKRIRRDVLKNQKSRCWDCEHKSPAENRRGRNVHHVNPVRERPDLALSEYDDQGRINLVCLCDSCHWERHHNRRDVVIPERW